MHKQEQNIVFPKTPRQLPAREEIEHVFGLPVAQLSILSRSGSTLVHSILDSHPEVITIPQVFKFYNFIAAVGDTKKMPPEQICDKFLAADFHHCLFDSRLSDHIDGRLGKDMNVFIRIDRAIFKTAFIYIIRHRPDTKEETVFKALNTAYAWCLGADLLRAKVIVQHLHHSDWLAPHLCPEKHNLSPAPEKDPDEVLKADIQIITMRDPGRCITSLYDLAGKLRPASEVPELYELFLRKLVQDWRRIEVIREKYAQNLLIIKLEDIKESRKEETARLCSILGISDNNPVLERLTFYGFDWHGDVYSAASTQPRKEKDRKIPWQDKSFIDCAIGSIARSYGYQASMFAKLKMLSSLLSEPETIRKEGNGNTRNTLLKRFKFLKTMKTAER